MPRHRAPGRRWQRLVAALGLLCLGVAGGASHLAMSAGADAAPIAAPAQPSRESGGRAVTAPTAAAQAPAPGFGTAPQVSGASPVELHISGGPTVPLQPVGVAADGGVQIPDDPHEAGWWVAGAAPADPTGATVLVGHLDSATRGLGAFAALLDLPSGSRLDVVDSTGATYRYRVTTRQQVAKSDLPATAFAVDGPPRLVLITCGGAFDRATHHYADNVIVTAVPADGNS